jgi:hypothetical protein
LAAALAALVIGGAYLAELPQDRSARRVILDDSAGQARGSPALLTLREKLIKIGAKVVCHAKAVTFQLAEVAVPRALFAAIPGRIGRPRAAPSPG